VLDVDVPDGCTVWFRPRIDGPVDIAFDAVAVSRGGANDRVSDLNCFWMARDARSPGDLLVANWWQSIRLIASGSTIRYFRRVGGLAH
jgi:hypothetical protein